VRHRELSDGDGVEERLFAREVLVLKVTDVDARRLRAGWRFSLISAPKRLRDLPSEYFSYEKMIGTECLMMKAISGHTGMTFP
jgi:hypothetical protein